MYRFISGYTAAIGTVPISADGTVNSATKSLAPNPSNEGVGGEAYICAAIKALINVANKPIIIEYNKSEVTTPLSLRRGAGGEAEGVAGGEAEGVAGGEAEGVAGCKANITMSMRNKVLMIIALLGIAVGSAQARGTNRTEAAETTVTYKIKRTDTEGTGSNSCKLTFDRVSGGLGTSNGSKEVTISNKSAFTGFDVELDDGLHFSVSKTTGTLTMIGNDEYKDIVLNTATGSSTSIMMYSTDYYIKNIKLTDLGGSPCNLSVRMFIDNDHEDGIDVDLVKYKNMASDFEYFYANVGYNGQLGVITVTYADEPREYTITYDDAVDGENGVTNNNPTSYNVETEELTITEASRTGYDFKGWIRDVGGNWTTITDPIVINRNSVIDTKDLDLYTKWKAHTYTVLFNRNGGIGTMDSQTFTYDEAKNLSANTFTRDNYTFAGWNTVSGGSGTSYTDGQMVSNLTDEDKATINLYAQWKGVDVAVNFIRGEGATGGDESVTATYGEPMPAITPPTRTGYCFGGYWSEADGKGTRYYNSLGTSTINCNTAGSPLVLYAYWLDPITYIDAQGNEATCSQYEVYSRVRNLELGKDGVDNWYAFDGVRWLDNVTFNGNTHIIVPEDEAAINMQNTITVNGNLDIYSQKDGKGNINVVNGSKINIGGNLSIHGGIVNLIIEEVNDINIGWTNPDDRINMSIGNCGTIKIKDGQYFKGNDRTCISGEVTKDDVINDKLIPAIPMREDADNSGLIASYSNKNAGIGLIGRTIYNDGAWNTICIPNSGGKSYDYNPIDNFYTIMELDTENTYNDAGVKDESGTYQTGIRDGILYLYFNEVDNIEPGKPYIVKMNDPIGVDVVDPFFGGTTIADVSAYSGSTGAEKCQAFLEDKCATDNSTIRFIGQFDPVTIDDSNRGKIIVLGAGNTLGFTSANTLHPCRAHFEILGNSNIKGYQLSFGEGKTTGIIPIKAEPAAQGIYTLDGLRIEGRPTKKGVYIKDGKKVVIND